MTRIKTHTHFYDVHPRIETHAFCTQCGFAVPAALLVRYKSVGWAVAPEQLSDALKTKLAADGLLQVQS